MRGKDINPDQTLGSDSAQPLVSTFQTKMPPPPDPYLAVAKRYAPVVVFHEQEQYFPCSIEYLLTGGLLKYRNFGDARQLANYQTLSDPFSAVLNGLTFVV